jgi:peptide/nickel transport system substrate-binding protein
VSQLGGLSVDLIGATDQVTRDTLAVLQSEWQRVGIQTTIHSYELPRTIQELQGKKWQAALQSNGAFDPGESNGLPFRFLSSAQYSGVQDPTLDNMIQQAGLELDPTKRGQLYAGIGKYISDQAYAPFLFAVAPAAITRKGVHGPGLTTKIPMDSVALLPVWDEVWMEKQ